MKFSLLIEALQDMKADGHRKRISKEELSFYCSNLAKKVRNDYEPDVIVAIATGGSTTGELVGKILKLPVVHITVRRDIKINRMYDQDPLPIRWMMSFYHHYLFRSKKPKVTLDVNVDVANKKVLIVDDTIHTGATVDVAVKYLTSSGSLEIKIASLAYISKRKPDFFVLPKGNYCFPWSRDF